MNTTRWLLLSFLTVMLACGGTVTLPSESDLPDVLDDVAADVDTVITPDQIDAMDVEPVTPDTETDVVLDVYADVTSDVVSQDVMDDQGDSGQDLDVHFPDFVLGDLMFYDLVLADLVATDKVVSDKIVIADLILLEFIAFDIHFGSNSLREENTGFCDSNDQCPASNPMCIDGRCECCPEGLDRAACRRCEPDQANVCMLSEQDRPCGCCFPRDDGWACIPACEGSYVCAQDVDTKFPVCEPSFVN